MKIPIIKTDTHVSLTVKIAVSVILALVVFAVFHFELLSTVSNSFNDFIYQKETQPLHDIYIIAIDDKTLDRYGQYDYWDRSVYADLIDRLYDGDHKPAVTGIDIMMTGYKNIDSDLRLAESIGKAGNIVLANIPTIRTHLVTDGTGELFEVPVVESVSYPYEELRRNCDTGFVINQPDADNITRRTIVSLSYNDEIIDSFAYAVCRKYASVTGASFNDYQKLEHSQYRFSFTEASQGSQFQVVSMCDVLDGKINPALFNRAIVLVGAYAEGFQDAFFVPVSGTRKMNGVEIHANIIDALFKNSLQSDADKDLLGIVYGLITAVCSFVLFMLNPIWGPVFVLFITVAQIIDCKIFYSSGTYINALVFPLVVLLDYIGMIVLHYIYARIDRQKINKAFKMYVAPQIVDEVAKNGKYELKLGGETKDIAVLFVDIRGFTTMSEGMPPEDVVGVLNEYFDIITNAIFKNGGTLDKFIGDACMAVFNSPFELDDYVFRAVKTAWDIAKGSKILSPKLNERFGRTVSYGIGVNAGPAVIGNIGSVFRMDFTAIGDTVNTASRLESNAKAGQILISETVYERVKDRITATEIGVIPLKGKSIGINVYSVTGINEP